MCGNISPRKISERRVELTGDFFTPPAYTPKETIYVFRCHCGATFTHRAKDGERSNQTIGTMNEDGREALAEEAQRLQCEIGRKVDNPNYLFRGDNGEACIANLRAVAQQCEAKGLHVAAERLSQLAHDAMRRWKD